MRPRRIFLYIHIPKTGGVTFLDVLARNFGAGVFGKGFCHDGGIFYAIQFEADQVEKILATYPEVTCYSTHSLSLDLPYDRADWDLRPMTIVRDPVSRFISHYFYHRHHTILVPQAKEMGLEEYTDWALARGNQPMYISGQTRFLTGQIGPEAIRQIEEHIVSHNLILLPLHRFDEACVMLERSFPDQFRDATYRISNVSKKDQKPDPGLLDRIRSYVGSDADLLAIADRQLDEMLNLSADDRVAAVEAFRERCRARSEPFEARSKLRGQLERILDVSPLKVYRRLRRTVTFARV